ncbi:MAG: acetyl-coenzyme A synthetase, partial [Pseudomonadota bacterium]|nr:acetyl-coenzyme A synthetase [Pseudomonadota bacterium]
MEEKIYDVPSEWSHRAYLDEAGYRAKYEASIKDPEAFWAEEAKRIHWFKAPTRIKNTNFGPENVAIRWFEDGITN